MLAAVLLGVSGAPILLQFGVADITPPEPLALGGYTARKDALGVVGDEKIHARCVMMSQGDAKPVFLVSVDLLTVPESLAEAVQAKVPEGELFLAATHTHSAPDSQMFNRRMNFKIPGIASFSERWLDWYSERIAEACRLALKMKPLRADQLQYRDVEIDANRGRRPGAIPNKEAFRLETEDGMPILATYAAHATIFEEDSVAVSGDWPGAWAAKLNCPVFVGALGDVSPAPEGKTPEEKIKAMVEKLQLGLEKSEKKLLLSGELSMRFHRESIELGKVTPHPSFAASYDAPEFLANMIVQKFAPPAASITAFSVGTVAFIGVPGELCSSLGAQIQAAGKKAGFEKTVIVSHTNGWIGYILDPEDYDKGGYEATLSFHGREIGQRVVAAAQKALSGLRNQGQSDSKAGSSGRRPTFEAA